MNLQEQISRMKSMMDICDDVTIYFAHPINTYYTEYESQAINIIKDKFPNSNIINPGEQKYQDMFKEYAKNNPKEYMGFFRDLVNTCSIIAYLPFRDGMVGAGVRYEIYHLSKRFDEIYEITLEDSSIKKVSMEYVDNNTLSIDETRKRIKEEY
jgi:hypothetical protein